MLTIYAKVISVTLFVFNGGHTILYVLRLWFNHCIVFIYLLNSVKKLKPPDAIRVDISVYKLPLLTRIHSSHMFVKHDINVPNTTTHDNLLHVLT